MATSGTVTFRTNRNELIKSSLRLIGGYDFENTSGPSANQISLGAEALNLLVKEMGSRGLQLWERKYAVIFPQKNQGVFALGSPGPAGDHACLTTPLNAGGFVSTTLTSGASSGATSVTVNSISSDFTAGIPAVSISNTYNIGIQLDSGFMFWTTVSGAPSGTIVTLANALTGDAGAGNAVYCYQTKLIRPLRISDAFIRQVGLNDVPVRIIPRENYNKFGQKTVTTSTPSQLYYDNQSNIGYVYTYPGFLQVNQLLYIEIQKPIDDFSSATDDYDLPQEWGNYLKYRLATSLAPEYEVSSEKFKQLQYLEAQSYSAVNPFDQEADSVFFGPGIS